MEKDFNLRNIVWLSMILVSAGSVYGMLSQRVTALESKQIMMEQAILEDIPEIKEIKEQNEGFEIGAAVSGSDFNNFPKLKEFAPGIAEALFATALGLLAAIPAVAAYNKFSGDMDKIGTSLDVFAQEFTTLLGRQLDEGGQ